MNLDVQNFLKRYNNAKAKWNQKSGIHQEAYEYSMPFRNKFFDKSSNENGQENVNLYDNTAVDSVPIFASRLLQMIAPEGKHWFRFELNDLVKKSMVEDERMDEDEIQEEQKILDNLTDIFFHYWNKSNGSTQLHEAFHDLAIGTSAIYINEGDDKNDPFDLEAIPLFDLSIEEGVKGIVDTVFRDYCIPLKSIEVLWPEAEFSQRLTEVIERDPTTKVKIVAGIIYNKKTKKFDYKVVVKDYDELVYKDSFLTNPFAISRWKLVAGEIYGCGPVIDLLPDIKVLNKAQEFMMRAAEKSTSEIFIGVEDGILNPDIGLQIEPDTMIFTEKPENFQRLGFNGRPDIAQAYIDQKQFNVKKKLLADSIDRAKALSPEEISALNNEKLFDTNAMFARLSRELLTPIILRIIDIMKRKGILGNFNYKPDIFTIKFTNPLSQIQNLTDSQLMLNTVSQIDTVLGVEKSETVLNKELMAKSVAQLSNIDAKFIRSNKEIESIKEKQKEQMEAMQMAEMQKQQGGQG